MKIDLLTCSKDFFRGALDAPKKEGILAILNACDKAAITLPNQVAYVLATAYHESAGHMRGIDEFGHGRNHKYGAMDPETGKIYFGRGIVQLTWRDNYRRFSPIAGVDLVHQPELANRLDISAKIICFGMKRAMFTGVGLDRYIVPGHADFLNARKIVNGLDASVKIADYAVRFSNLLS